MDTDALKSLNEMFELVLDIYVSYIDDNNNNLLKKY